jgi:hypothetical protein
VYSIVKMVARRSGREAFGDLQGGQTV